MDIELGIDRPGADPAAAQVAGVVQELAGDQQVELGQGLGLRGHGRISPGPCGDRFGGVVLGPQALGRGLAQGVEQLPGPAPAAVVPEPERREALGRVDLAQRPGVQAVAVEDQLPPVQQTPDLARDRAGLGRGRRRRQAGREDRGEQRRQDAAAAPGDYGEGCKHLNE
jgi:hypothetical protein